MMWPAFTSVTDINLWNKQTNRLQTNKSLKLFLVFENVICFNVKSGMFQHNCEHTRDKSCMPSFKLTRDILYYVSGLTILIPFHHCAYNHGHQKRGQNLQQPDCNILIIIFPHSLDYRISYDCVWFDISVSQKIGSLHTNISRCEGWSMASSPGQGDHAAVFVVTKCPALHWMSDTSEIL